MKKYIFILITLIFSFQLLFSQQRLFTKAKLNSVSIYKRSAEIESVAKVKLPRGTSEVIIENIGDEIQEGSLRVLMNNNDVTVLSSQHYSENEEQKSKTIDFGKKKLIDSIALLKKKLEENTILLESNNKTVDLLDNNKTILLSSKYSSVNELKNLTQFYEQKRNQLKIGAIKIRDLNNHLANRIKKLKNKLQSNDEDQLYGEGIVILKINSSRNTELNFTIKYLTGDVSWTPLYEIKGTSINDPLTVTLKASIKQNMGIDWKQVKLNLIDGYSSKYSSIPELSPWFLKSHNPKRANISFKKAKRISYEEEKEEDSLEEVVVTGYDVKPNYLNTSYTTKIPYDIQSNYEPHVVTISNQKITPLFSYYTVPNYSKKSFLIAKIKDFSKYNFINAKASIIFENMYVGETYISVDNVGDELKISLGDDPRVSIKRENIKDKSGRKFFSSNQQKTTTYDLVLRNNKKENISIEIKDRFPVSNDEDVKVELLNISGAKKDMEKGFLIWNEVLKSNQTKKIRVSYKVIYPKNYTISNF